MNQDWDRPQHALIIALPGFFCRRHDIYIRCCDRQIFSDYGDYSHMYELFSFY